MCVCGHTGVYLSAYVFVCFNFIFKILTNFKSDDYVAVPFVIMPRETPTVVCSLNS